MARRVLVDLAAATAAGFAAYLGYLRVGGLDSEGFQAVAHVFVGLMFGFGFGARKRFPFVVALALTLLEVVCFYFRIGK